MRQQTEALIRNYYDAFNRNDMSEFLNLLTDDVIHDINQGERETGKEAFSQFMQKMNAHYHEQIDDLTVLSDVNANKAAAEFTVTGSYLKTDEGLPEADGQTYRLRAGAFFDVNDGRISRVSNYYNLNDWISQVSGDS
ncbi:MAG: ketosteroid isomerase-related protein [Granulosicoccus sp.]